MNSSAENIRDCVGSAIYKPDSRISPPLISGHALDIAPAATVVHPKLNRASSAHHGKAPEDWRTPRRFAFMVASVDAAASWSAAALRRFHHKPRQIRESKFCSRV
jgi:hypothetical protein